MDLTASKPSPGAGTLELTRRRVAPGSGSPDVRADSAGKSRPGPNQKGLRFERDQQPISIGTAGIAILGSLRRSCRIVGDGRNKTPVDKVPLEIVDRTVLQEGVGSPRLMILFEGVR